VNLNIEIGGTEHVLNDLLYGVFRNGKIYKKSYLVDSDEVKDNYYTIQQDQLERRISILEYKIKELLEENKREKELHEAKLESIYKKITSNFKEKYCNNARDKDGEYISTITGILYSDDESTSEWLYQDKLVEIEIDSDNTND